MLATTTLALLVLAHLEAAAGSSFCGGFDLDNNGQAGQCLSDDNSRNGCYNIYGHSNPCWTPAPMNSCCGHGRCSGQYDRYNQHCTCDAGWTGSRCDTAAARPPPPPPPPPPSPPSTSGGGGAQFTVTSGPCTLSNGGNCVGRPSSYSASERCQISSNKAGTVQSCSVFNTERGYDFLNIDGTNYDGDRCPRGVTLSSRSTISWVSDGSVAGDGWEICAAGGSSGSTATSGGQGFSVTSGPCTTTQGGSCVGRLQYGNHESCEIRSNGPASIANCPVFNTERGYDFLNIAGTNYDGTNCPRGVTLNSGTTIRWTSDGSVAGDGWQICAAASSGSGSVSRPPPSPPTPAPAPTCPSGERDCGNTPNCGWCISNTYDSGCLPSNEFGVMEPNPYGNCNRGYQAGQFRPPGSMCVSVISDQDVRCYQDCMPTATMESFVVPDQATCLSYDSAFGARQVPFAKRAQAYENVASHLIGQALGKLSMPGHSSDCTRGAMGSALQTLETEGLSHLETAACSALTDGAGSYFCGQLFEGSFGGFVNGAIVHSSIVSQFNSKLINAATHAVPPSYMDKIDQVCQAYQACTRNAACSQVRSAVAEAGAHLAQSHFGYGSGSGHRRLESPHRNITDYFL